MQKVQQASDYAEEMNGVNGNKRPNTTATGS